MPIAGVNPPPLSLAHQRALASLIDRHYDDPAMPEIIARWIFYAGNVGVIGAGGDTFLPVSPWGDIAPLAHG